MIRKYHNHKLQTTPWHREEEPLNHHETPGRQIKQSNQLKSFFCSSNFQFSYSQIDKVTCELLQANTHAYSVQTSPIRWTLNWYKR